MLKEIINEVVKKIKSIFLIEVKEDDCSFMKNVDSVKDYLDNMKELIFNDPDYICNKYVIKDMWFIANHYRLLMLSRMSKFSGIDKEIANFRLTQFVDDMDLFNSDDNITDNYKYNLCRISHKYNIDIISIKELYK